MKSIQPITIWANGHPIEANKLNLKLIADNLLDSATFYYELLNYTQKEVNVMLGETEYIKLTEGNLTIEGEDYQNWNGGNDEIYTLCTTKLNLTLS